MADGTVGSYTELVNQIAPLLNDAVAEYAGIKPVTGEDATVLNLENVVSEGFKILEGSDQPSTAYTTVYGGLLTRLTKLICEVRRLQRRNIIMVDELVYGSMVEKIYFEPVQAEESAIWQLQNGQSIDPFIVSAPQIQSKVFQLRNTWQVPFTISWRQIRAFFMNAEEMGRFIAGIYDTIANSVEMQLETVQRLGMANYIGERLNANNAVQSVHLLTEYNNANGGALTAQEAITTPDFLRFMSARIRNVMYNMGNMGTTFSAGGQYHFTPEEDLRAHIINEAMVNMETYLESDTFHNDMVRLNGFERTPFWQGSGETWAFADTSAINVTTASKAEVSKTGIVAFIHDIDALGMTVWARDTTTQYNGRGDYTNYWANFETGLFNDLDENAVVFVLD